MVVAQAWRIWILLSLKCIPWSPLYWLFIVASLILRYAVAIDKLIENIIILDSRHFKWFINPRNHITDLATYYRTWWLFYNVFSIFLVDFAKYFSIWSSQSFIGGIRLKITISSLFLYFCLAKLLIGMLRL